MRKYQLLFLVFFSVFLLLGCNNNNTTTEVIRFQGKTMGTRYHVTIVVSKDQTLPPKNKIKKQIDNLLATLNQQMSTYQKNSEISQFNRYQKMDWFPVSNDLAFVVNAAQQVSKATQGAFDITVAPLVERWGFGAKEQFEIPNQAEIKALLKNTGYLMLDVRQHPSALKKTNTNIQIDLSAIAKGFAVDKLVQALEKIGVSNLLVEIGGEIRNKGLNQNGKPWRIGIEQPGITTTDKNNDPVSLLSTNVAIATSGNYRNYFIKKGMRYSHTINPVTGRPVTHRLASVTVLHNSTMLADAYATALMVMGLKKGKDFARKQQLRVNLIVEKEQGKFEGWNTINQTKEEWRGEKCQKVGGCTFYD